MPSYPSGSLVKERKRRTGHRSPQTAQPPTEESAFSVRDWSPPTSMQLVIARATPSAASGGRVPAAPLAQGSSQGIKRRFCGLDVFYDPQSRDLQAELECTCPFLMFSDIGYCIWCATCRPLTYSIGQLGVHPRSERALHRLLEAPRYRRRLAQGPPTR